MDDNELLRMKFQRFHAELVGQNLSAVVDRLFAAAVISTANLDELQRWSGTGSCWTSAKSRSLMTLLHRSGHPRAFTELRRALSEDDATTWIVDKLDKVELDEELEVKANEDSAPCQCSNCGRPHYRSSPSAEGQRILKIS